MVVNVYISGISGNKEVKKRQQRVLMILDSKNIKYDVIDITEPGREADKDFMQTKSTSNGGTVSDPNPRSPLPPQVFNDDEYCGDYDQFDMANELDTLEQFLKLEVPPEETPQPENGQVEKSLNGDVGGKASSKENSQERDKAASKEGTPAKESTPAKEGTPARASKEATPARASKEATPAKEGTPARESKEATPAKESTPEKITEESQAKEPSPEKQKSVEKEIEAVHTTEVESSRLPKESTPVKEEVNENGSAGPVEAGAAVSAANPSEALIASEQSAASD